MNPTPTQQFSMPGSHTATTQIAQIKAAGITGGQPSANPQTKSPNTQGLPQAVTNLRVAKQNISATQVRLTISFGHNPGDPYLETVKIYQKTSDGNPVQVAAGNQSPIVLTATRTSKPTTIIAQSSGNWGSTPINSSPSKSVDIR